jgi:hypothetical protein
MATVFWTGLAPRYQNELRAVEVAPGTVTGKEQITKQFYGYRTSKVVVCERLSGFALVC